MWQRWDTWLCLLSEAHTKKVFAFFCVSEALICFIVSPALNRFCLSTKAENFIATEHCHSISYISWEVILVISSFAAWWPVNLTYSCRGWQSGTWLRQNDEVMTLQIQTVVKVEQEKTWMSNGTWQACWGIHEAFFFSCGSFHCSNIHNETW